MSDEVTTAEEKPPMTDAEYEKSLLDLSIQADKQGLFIFITSNGRGQYMRPDVLRNRIYLGERFPRELEFSMREPRELEEQYMSQVHESEKLLASIRIAIGEHKEVLGHEVAREAEYAGIEDMLRQFAKVPTDSPEYTRQIRDVAVSIRNLVTSNLVSQLQTQATRFDDSPKSARVRDQIINLIRKP